MSLEFDQLFNDTIKYGYGCVLFDIGVDPKTGKNLPLPGKGWASANGEAAFRINSLDELDTTIKWITNLDRITFWGTGCVRYKKLRDTQFFKTDLNYLMRELNIVPKQLRPELAVQKLSELFSRLMRIAQKYYGINEIKESDFSEELKQLLIPPDNLIDNAIDEALARAYVDYIQCPIGKTDSKRLVFLKLPRYKHANDVLNTVIPYGKWILIDPADIASQKDPLQWLIDTKKPVLVKVQLRHFLQDCPVWVPSLMQMGEVLTLNSKKTDRSWMTLQEVQVYSKYAKIDILAAFVAEHWVELKTSKKVPNLGELSDFSVSLGIIAESHWLSLAARSRHPVIKQKVLVSPRACWLKAADRFFCFTAALPIAACGFSIYGYGNGTVSVMVSEEEEKTLKVAAIKAGLVLPANLIKK